MARTSSIEEPASEPVQLLPQPVPGRQVDYLIHGHRTAFKQREDARKILGTPCVESDDGKIVGPDHTDGYTFDLGPVSGLDGLFGQTIEGWYELHGPLPDTDGLAFRFQAARGITPSAGYVGRLTRAALALP